MRKTYKDIIEKAYCDPSKRMDFILFFEVEQGNPNGDPDAGNLPRIDPTDNYGIVTDVATKRKIRDYIDSAHQEQIFIQNRTALNSCILDTARSIANGEKESEDESDDETAKNQELAKGFFAEISASDTESKDKKTSKRADEFLKLILSPGNGDVNPTLSEFGEFLKSIESSTLIFEADKSRLTYCGDHKKEGDIKNGLLEEIEVPLGFEKQFNSLIKLLSQAKGDPSRETKDLVKRRMARRYYDIRMFGAVLTAGTNAGQIRGPMQLTFARSLEPIVPIEASITRVAITTAADFLKKQTEMGRKPYVSWAAYEQHGFYNAPLGAEPNNGGTGISKEDLARFWEALAYMFPEAKSASNGYMEAVELLVFVHDDEKGRSCAPFFKIREKVKLAKHKDATETTKGFFKVYDPVTVDDEEKLAACGVSVFRPFKDLRPDL
jgi:CRISPR-associated protein Csd2